MNGRVKVGALSFDNVSKKTAAARVLSLVGEGGLVVTPNLDHLMRASREEEFQRLYGKARLSLADGAPVVWLARLSGVRLHRVPGADLFPMICELAAERSLRVTVVGMPDVESAAELEAKLTRDFRGLDAQVISPPFGFERDARELSILRQELKSFRPDVVFSCLGSPKQEVWAQQESQFLPNTVFIGAGASALFYSGSLRRAPRWMRSLGVEWSFRLLTEPRRLAKRYLRNALFFVRILATLIRRDEVK